MKLGILSIGRTPRPDLEADFSSRVRGPVLVEGALDGLNRDEARRLEGSDGYPLLTRLRDGTTLNIPMARLIPLLTAGAKRLAAGGAGLAVLACSGDFPDLEADIPVVFPSRVVKAVAHETARGERVGLLIPIAEQVSSAVTTWEAAGLTVTATACSPYHRQEFEAAVQEMKASDCALVVLDCMGYGQDFQRDFEAACDKPTLLVRSLVARVVGSLT